MQVAAFRHLSGQTSDMDEEKMLETIQQTAQYVNFDHNYLELMIKTSGENQHFKIFEWLWSLPHLGVRERDQLSSHLHLHAIRHECVALLEKLYELKIKPYTQEEIAFAIKLDKLAIANWLLDHKYTVSIQAFEKAAEKRNVELLDKLYETYVQTMISKGYTITSQQPSPWYWINARHPNIISWGIEYDDIALINWAITHDILFTLDDVSYACQRGGLHILKMMNLDTLNLDTLNLRYDHCASAAEHGYLEILQYLRVHNCPWDERVADGAIKYGNLENLQWIVQNGCRINSEGAIYLAAYYGHLHIVKWLRSQGYKWGYDFIKITIQNGHHHIIRWVYENNYPFDPIVFSHIMKYGNLELLKWACATLPKTPIFASVVECKNLNMIHWLLENGYDNFIPPKPIYCDINPYLSMKYLHDNYGWFPNYSDYLTGVESCMSELFYDDLATLIKQYL